MSTTSHPLPYTEMNFCRRCGKQMHATTPQTIFECDNGHVIYNMMATGTDVLLFNTKGELLVIRRAIDPGKGMLDVPGGFSVLGETLEDTLAREIDEEVGISADQYSELEYVTNGVDAYPYKGETFQVLVVVYRAILNDNVVPVARDDAMSYEFIPLDAINPDEFFSTSLQKALQQASATR